MKRYLILGGGIAALSAAKAIRKQDASGLIVLLTNEDALPYNRPALTKQLLSDLSAADLAVESAAWYDAPGRDILVLTGRTVSAIDTEKKTVSLADGLVFPYDKLIYALGARCFIPPFKGSDRANVIAVRSAADAARVRELAKSAKSAAVIGGGVLGLEAAWSLRQGGLEVTVIEFDQQIMSRQIDAEAAAHLMAAMAKHGVQLLTRASTAFVDDEGLHLTDGRVIPADIVLVSAGVRANMEIAAAAGIRAERKIVVDERMATSAPDVYAAGDCAAFGMSYALWTEAAEMGRVAGVNAAGGNASYKVVPRPLIFHGFETELFAIGDVGRNPDKTYEVGSMPGARYYSVDGKVVGAILEGDTSRALEAKKLVLENA
ncbi:MAG: NAD(P)/FAD-dependent oxidoreductase [Aristaeellaceae bacterium]